MRTFARCETNGMVDPLRSESVYLETNVFIYAVEGLGETAGLAKKLLGYLRDRPGMAVTSELTLAEVLAPAQRKEAWPVHVKQRVYLDLLVWNRAVTLLPVTRDFLIETAKVRIASRMKLPDAIHLVSATRSNCQFLVSGDGDFRFSTLPTTIKPLRATSDDIERLLRELV